MGTLLALFAVAFGARVMTAMLFGDPIYPDAYYYVSVARELASGHGFQVAYVWNFVDVGGRLPLEGSLPIPSNAHWMPLAALVQVPFIWLLGPTALASALPFWIAASVVAPLTYLIGMDAGMSRLSSVCAGVLMALPGTVAPYLGQADNFALFMLLGSLALWLCARGLRGDRRAFAAGGLVVGLAFLARNDGVLLGLPFALAFAADLRRGAARRIGWLAAVGCAAGFLVIVAPWLWRQVDVFGSISPSSASGRILFIRDYRELYSVSSEATLQSFLDQGIGQLLLSRLEGLRSALFVFAVTPLLVVLVPFVLLGSWLRRRDTAFVPWLVYAVALFAFSALVAAVHVPYGTFLHSAVALVPHAYLLAFVGLGAVVRWVAARRPSWDAPRATRNFSVLLVVVVMLVSVVGSLLTVRNWRAERDTRDPILAALAERAAPGDVVMSPDAGAYRYWGGWPGIVTPDDPLPVIEEALRRYDVRWLALERAHMVHALAPLLDGAARPDWLSEPIVVVREEVLAGDATSSAGRAAVGTAETGTGTAGRSSGERPVAALFAVCLAADDARCTA
jgi:4-amino-4-deoxy-L-arabinose transferase-like glycosyltransferase